MFEGLKNAFEAGGWPMYVNLFMSAVVLAIIAERAVVLYVRGRRLNKVHFMTQVTGFITRGDYRRAITYCDVMSTPLSRIVKAGLIAAPKSDEEAQAAMDEASLRELPNLERRTGYLAMLGNVATLVGLFGTILGLIHSFGAVAMADPSEKAALLARGISEAMNNTAFGLGIAIPALVCFSLFQGRTQHMVDDINEAAVSILNLVTNNRKNLRNVPKDDIAVGA
jgi:biopolymer transport protein ExbB/TolQ